MGIIREPIRKSSIEKKNKIVEKGFELICERGYHNTTAIDIANYAEVSTGIIYQYFKDKKDILIHGIDNYYDKVTTPILELLEAEKINSGNLEAIVSKVINAFIDSHKLSTRAHKELDALEYLDEDIEQIFIEKELILTNRVVEILEENNLNINNPTEKVHLIYGIIDKFAHEMVYHQHHGYDYNFMKAEITKIILDILK